MRYCAIGFFCCLRKMKSTLLKTAVLFALGIACSTGAQAADKWRVAVAELQLSEALSASAAKTVQQSSLRTDIEDAIRNGRKFEVVTRNAAKMKAIRDEQKFAQSGLAAGDAAATGQLSNAQSLVLVEVQNFSFGRSSSKVPNIENKYRISDYASIELNVQILDTSKGTMTGSFNVEAKASSGTRVANSVGAPSRDILDKALDRAAADLANQLSDTIFPITVIQAKGKQLYVNRGKDGGLKVGDQFVIFQPGEALIDPTTGENLGSAEEEVGLGKVVRVNPKFTIVEVTKGDPSLMAAGFILRRPVGK